MCKIQNINNKINFCCYEFCKRNRLSANKKRLQIPIPFGTLVEKNKCLFLKQVDKKIK